MPPEPHIVNRPIQRIKLLSNKSTSQIVNRGTNGEIAKTNMLKDENETESRSSLHHKRSIGPHRHLNNSGGRSHMPGNGFSPSMGGGMYPGMMGGMYGGMMPMMMGAGMMNHPYAGGLMSFMYSMNCFVSLASQMVHFVGMNSHKFVEMVQAAKSSLLNLEKIVRQSAFRRWLQRKSKKSIILRYLFVFTSGVLTYQLYNIARYIVEYYLHGGHNNGRIMVPPSSSYAQGSNPSVNTPASI